MIVKVKILRPLEGVYAKYQPEVNGVYEANYKPKYAEGHGIYNAVCVINIADKKICLKPMEYEIVDE